MVTAIAGIRQTALRFKGGRRISKLMGTLNHLSHFFILCSLLLMPVGRSSELFSADKEEPKVDGFTINYNTVPIIEYIRFASKICGVNFVFNEEDLNFTVTIVSEEPATPESVMTTLLQVLRIHGLQLLEQDNNLVIHKAPGVKQLAKVITDSEQEKNAPIVTRIFRLKKANPTSVATILKPMISESAMIEVSVETHQIILTDVTGNVDKVASLIENIDSPINQLDIKEYEAKFNSPDYLIHLTGQIMGPLSQGDPFILVPAPLSNQIFIVSSPDLTDRALSVLKGLDQQPSKSVMANRQLKGENIFVYKLLHAQGPAVIKGLQNIASNLSAAGTPDPDLLQTIQSAKWIPETNSILLVGSSDSMMKAKEFLTALDAPGKTKGGQNSFFIYKPMHRSAKEIKDAIEQMASNLKGAKGADPAMIEAMQSATINTATQTITFSGDETTFPQIKELLTTIDAGKGKAPKESSKSSFFLYKIQSSSPTQVENSLKSFANNLDKSNASDEGLIDTIDEMKYIKETHSILFTGPDEALQRLKELLPSFDTPTSTPASSQFFIYKPKHQKGEQLAASLKDVTENLESNHLADPGMLQTLKSMKWVKSTNSLLFTGDKASIQRLEELLQTLDMGGTGKSIEEKGFFLFHPQYATKDNIQQYISEVTINLKEKGGDPDLIEALESLRWIAESQSFMFSGSEKSLAKIKELLATYEQEPQPKARKPGYYIYKLQHTSGSVIEDDLDNLSKNFRSSGLKESKVLDVIENMRYIKETNSLLLTGDPQAIEEVKALISEYDFPRSAPKLPANSNFFMYKPQSLSPNQIEKSLREVGNNLKRAGLADPELLTAIESAKYVDSTNSLIFTGSPETLAKIQGLVRDIDVATPIKTAPIQQIGKTTFLLYKIKSATSTQLISSLKSISMDLRKSGSNDKEFLTALGSMKYIKDTHSLLFTGDEPTLLRIQALVEKFDVPGPATAAPEPMQTGPSNFFVYKPLSLSGEELEKLMQDFAENLKMTGLSDPDLFNTINSMRWVEKSQSLIFTGNEKSLGQVKALLKDFDIPSNLPQGAEPTSQEPSIQAIDNTSFLVYKLQFHKGSEIQGALRQIAKDLILTNAQINQGLLNSINSIQWLEVTNSLLCSGDQETLTRLKELIKNLDIPLKQVFIEMLVIQTSLSNTLNFGLEWGAKYNYRNKFAGSLNNLPPPSPTTGTGLDPFATALNNFVPPGTLNPQTQIPFQNGFDLGVIGQVIKHNNTTYLDLGSLLSALQTDEETVIVMTPKIITQDGRTSTLFSGQNIPFAGSFVSNNSSNTTGTTNIEYRDVGVNLTITPVLGNSNIVTLDITLNQTSVPTDASQNQITFNSSGIPSSINGITSSKINMQTTVHVPDNNFLILSGMINNNNDRQKSAIPCLGGLPIIGAAFTKDQNLSTNTNLVIFLRPHILTSMEDLQKITAEQQEFFRDNMDTPNLVNQFDEAIEMMKPIEED